MTMQSHLTELERKHRALDKEIERAESHPATNDITIRELKVKKLRLKEEIVRIAAKASPSMTIH